MTTGWQNIVTLLLVAAATAYVLRTTWRAVRGGKSGSCGSCGSCGAPKDVVSIDVLKRSSH